MKLLNKIAAEMNEDIAGEYDRKLGRLYIYSSGDKGVEYPLLGSISYEDLKNQNYKAFLNKSKIQVPDEHLRVMFNLLKSGKFNGNDGIFDFRFKPGDVNPTFVKQD